MHKHPYRFSRGKCVCGGIAFAFLLSLAMTHGMVETLSTTIVERAHASIFGEENIPLYIMVGQWLIKLAWDVANWVAQKVFFGLLLAIFIIILGRIVVWAIYTLVITTATPLIVLMINIVESTLSPAPGTTAYLLFYSPVVQNGLHTNLWTISRDVVNIGFAAVLLFGAIMTIIKANKEFLERFALKFIVALILVNFSWFIPRVVVDAATVSTRAIFTLGTSVPCADCKEITAAVARPFASASAICPTALICIEVRPLTPNNSANYVVGGLSTFLAQILQQGQALNPTASSLILPLLSFGGIAGLVGIGPSPADLLAETIILALGLFLIMLGTGAYLFVLIALALAFLIRIPLLWLTMGFMPFVALGFVMDQLKPLTDKVWKQFLSAAFMPVMAGIPITVGFIMLRVVQNTPGATATLNNVTGSGVGGAFSALPNLLFIALAIIILWMGVFAALKSNEYIGMGSAAIKSTGEKFGKIGAFGYGAGSAALAGGFGFALAKRPLQALGKTGFGKKWLGADKLSAASALALPAQIMKARQKYSPDQLWANIRAGKSPLGAKTMSADKAVAAAAALKGTPLGTQFQKSMRTLSDGNVTEEERKKAGEEFQKILDTLASKVGDFDRGTTEQKVDAVKKIVAADSSVAGSLPSDWMANLRQNIGTTEGGAGGSTQGTTGSVQGARGTGASGGVAPGTTGEKSRWEQAGDAAFTKARAANMAYNHLSNPEHEKDRQELAGHVNTALDDSQSTEERQKALGEIGKLAKTKDGRAVSAAELPAFLAELQKVAQRNNRPDLLGSEADGMNPEDMRTALANLVNTPTTPSPLPPPPPIDAIDPEYEGIAQSLLKNPPERQYVQKLTVDINDQTRPKEDRASDAKDLALFLQQRGANIDSNDPRQLIEAINRLKAEIKRQEGAQVPPPPPAAPPPPTP